MTERGVLEKVQGLFERTGKAHHKAFKETDGYDPEWPLWYAEHLMKNLAALLKAGFTKSELVYLIVTAENERSRLAPGAPWASFYARFFIEKYL